MIKRFTLEFALDNQQLVTLRNHCEHVDDYTQNIKAMLSGALRSGDHDSDIEYISEKVMALRDEDLDDGEEAWF